MTVSRVDEKMVIVIFVFIVAAVVFILTETSL